ncbi:SusE domain-containing protein [Foetidibacter luteolus]|uniref:SusE domain-containing protein n=1 Tax=Foetidibacter luteolus TaxID=2608880 RepID=UPI00129B5B3D|nr:SusE domain-containing protein [Foetidibacter luteolus]
MKNIIQSITLSLLAAVMLLSCEKDENQVFLEGGTPPELTAVTNATTDSINLNFADADKSAISLNWTNPDYRFTTGVSSQDVSYLIEIDTVGASFSNPQKQTVAVSKELGKSFKVSEINDYLLNQLQLVPGIPHQIEIRVKSNLVNNSATLSSNALSFRVTPYAIPPKVAPPTTGELFLVGDATDGGWDNPVPVPSQQFTRVSETLYELTVPLAGGKQYLFIPKNGDWGNKFACKKTADQSADGGDFGFNWSDNFPGPAAGGTYKIQVDFQRGKYTVTKQ